MLYSKSENKLYFSPLSQPCLLISQFLSTSIRSINISCFPPFLSFSRAPPSFRPSYFSAGASILASSLVPCIIRILYTDADQSSLCITVTLLAPQQNLQWLPETGAHQVGEDASPGIKDPPLCHLRPQFLSPHIQIPPDHPFTASKCTPRDLP